MRKLLGVLFVFVSIQVNSQNVYTKDGVLLGTEKQLLESCLQGGTEAMVELNGIQVDIKKYCSCAMINLMPNITMDEISSHIEEGDIMGFLTQGENLKTLMDCLEPNMEVDDDYALDSNSKHSELQKSGGIAICSMELLENPEMKDLMSEEQAIQYCTCAIEGMYAEGYTYAEILEVDENSIMFNEIFIPCMTAALENETNSRPPPEEVVFETQIEEIPLVNLGNNLFSVKIEADGVMRYFMLDSGASDVTINEKTEKEYLKKGIIGKKDYVGTEEYELADGSTMVCAIFNMPSYKIGEFTLYNVQTAVVPNGSLLLGQSFLNKFVSWRISNENNVLILEKKK